MANGSCGLAPPRASSPSEPAPGGRGGEGTAAGRGPTRERHAHLSVCDLCVSHTAVPCTPPSAFAHRRSRGRAHTLSRVT